MAVDGREPDPAHFDEVAQAQALALLRDNAVNAGEVGRVSKAEALAAAECYARLAAAIGTPDDRRQFVSILLARADLLANANLPSAGLRREAAEHLSALAYAGDDRAALQLDALRDDPALPDFLPPDTAERIASTFARAAHGDAQTLLGLIDGAMAMTLCGGSKFDGLVQAENYARLANHIGCPTGTVSLAATLLLRWEGGEATGHRDHAVEGLGLALSLIDQEEAYGAALVSAALTDVSPDDLAYFVRHLPSLLAHCTPEGTA